MIYPVPKFQSACGLEGNLRGKETRTMAEELALLAADENREVVTVALAARLLGKSRDTVYRWLEAGRLSGRKVGGRWLVYRDSVEAEWKSGLVERT